MIDAGELAIARFLEPVAMLWIPRLSAACSAAISHSNFRGASSNCDRPRQKLKVRFGASIFCSGGLLGAP
jgi:hypothetical protein